MGQCATCCGATLRTLMAGASAPGALDICLVATCAPTSTRSGHGISVGHLFTEQMHAWVYDSCVHAKGRCSNWVLLAVSTARRHDVG